MLRQPDFDLPFAIHTDASGLAIGAILTQTDNKNQEYIIAYASRLLKGAEIHYGITEKECLAVIWAIKKYQIYHYSLKFEIWTDHSALTWLMQITEQQVD